MGAYPFQTPNTNPARVKQVLYPINGGKLTSTTRPQSIIHPVLECRHLSTKGVSAAKIFLLNARNRIPSMKRTSPATPRAMSWTAERERMREEIRS